MSSVLSIGSTVKLASGHSMPLLGLGVYQNRGETVVSACLAAFEAGYRHVDSAQLYRNEAEVGDAVRKSGLARENVFITSKIRSPDHGYDKTLKKLDKSLSQFNFTYLDLFLIHDPLSGKDKRLETWKAIVKARDEGKIKSIGVSNYGVHHLEEIAEAGLEIPAINQVELHPFCQQRPIVEYCKAHSIVIQAYCPLMRGQEWDNHVLKEVAGKHGKEVGHVLVRWSLQKGYSPLPKSSQVHRVKNNALVYDFELSDEEMEKIDTLDKGASGALSWNPVNAA